MLCLVVVLQPWTYETLYHQAQRWNKINQVQPSRRNGTIFSCQPVEARRNQYGERVHIWMDTLNEDLEPLSIREMSILI